VYMVKIRTAEGRRNRRLAYFAIPRRRQDLRHSDVDLVCCGRDDVYVRAYNGQNFRWYMSAMSQHAGRITASGFTKDVMFDPVSGEINERIDEAYRAKYKNSPYLDPMIGPRARAATVRVVPRKTA
jgi:hypothetical protein